MELTKRIFDCEIAETEKNLFELIANIFSKDPEAVLQLTEAEHATHIMHLEYFNTYKTENDRFDFQTTVYTDAENIYVLDHKSEYTSTERLKKVWLEFENFTVIAIIGKGEYINYKKLDESFTTFIVHVISNDLALLQQLAQKYKERLNFESKRFLPNHEYYKITYEHEEIHVFDANNKKVDINARLLYRLIEKMEMLLAEKYNYHGPWYDITKYATVLITPEKIIFGTIFLKCFDDSFTPRKLPWRNIKAQGSELILKGHPKMYVQYVVQRSCMHFIIVAKDVYGKLQKVYVSTEKIHPKPYAEDILRTQWRSMFVSPLPSVYL